MTFAGYSKRPLVDKLGIKAGMTALIRYAPDGYEKTLGAIPMGVTWRKRLGGQIDFIQAFFTQAAKMEAEFSSLKNSLSSTGMLWVCWPKKTSGVHSDISDMIVRELGLRHGLVDVKVCAIDETWSGLKFVYRVKDRKK